MNAAKRFIATTEDFFRSRESETAGPESPAVSFCPPFDRTNQNGIRMS